MLDLRQAVWHPLEQLVNQSEPHMAPKPSGIGIQSNPDERLLWRVEIDELVAALQAFADSPQQVSLAAASSALNQNASALVIVADVLHSFDAAVKGALVDGVDIIECLPLRSENAIV